MPETVFRGDKLTLNVYLSATHPQIMPETAFRAEAHEPTMEKKRSSVMKVCPYAYNVKMRLKQRQCVLGYPSIDLIQKHPSSLTELPVVCLYEHFSTYLPISWTVSHSVRSSLCFSSLHIFFILSASIYLSIHLFIRILVIINYLSLPQIIYLSSPPLFHTLYSKATQSTSGLVYLV